MAISTASFQTILVQAIRLHLFVWPSVHVKNHESLCIFAGHMHTINLQYT